MYINGCLFQAEFQFEEGNLIRGRSLLPGGRVLKWMSGGMNGSCYPRSGAQRLVPGRPSSGTLGLKWHECSIKIIINKCK